MTNETAPGLQVQSDQDWEDWLKGEISTEYHPCSTCAMLPLEHGGVVDANLRVYGLANVRVADASVPPIDFAAHLMSSTYGLAEQASTMIRAFHNGVATKPSPSNSTKGSGADSSSSNTPVPAAAATTSPASSSDSKHHSAVGVGVGVGLGVPFALAALVALLWFLRRRRSNNKKSDESGLYGVVRVVPSTEALDQHELDESTSTESLFKPYGALPTLGNSGDEKEKDYRLSLTKKESRVGVSEVPPGVD